MAVRRLTGLAAPLPIGPTGALRLSACDVIRSKVTDPRGGRRALRAVAGAVRCGLERSLKAEMGLTWIATLVSND